MDINVSRIKKQYLSCRNLFVQKNGETNPAKMTQKKFNKVQKAEVYFLVREENPNKYIVYSKASRNYYITDYNASVVFKEALPNRTISEIVDRVRGILNLTHEDALQFTKRVFEKLHSNDECDLNFKLKAPVRVGWRLTDRCNINCRHCFNGGNGIKEFSLKEIENTIDQLKENGICEVILTGGEPLCHPDILNIVEALKDRGLTIFTNGILIPKHIDVLKNYDIKYLISLDGFEKEHDYIRGSGTYAATMKALEVLEENNLFFAVNCVVSKNNIDIMEEFIDYHREKKRFVQVSYIVPMGNSLENESILLSESDKAKLNSIMKKYYGDLGIDNINEKQFICGGGRVKFDILSDGTVVPCSFTDKFAMGNIHEQSLKEIWGSNSKQEFLSYLGDEIISGPCRVVKEYYDVNNFML